jgi:hypothetical protein
MTAITWVVCHHCGTENTSADTHCFLCKQQLERKP